LGYIVVEPALAPPDAPMVLALHGRGDHPEAFAKLAERLALPVRTIIVRGPLRVGAQGRQWYDPGSPGATEQVRAVVADLVRLLDVLRARYPGAPKPALYGFSQGAVVALQAVVEQPQLFSAVAPLSGHLLDASVAAPAVPAVPILVVWGT